MMAQKNSMMILVALCCLLLFAGCHTENGEDTASRERAASAGDQLLNDAQLRGSVTATSGATLQVNPVEDDGETAVQAVANDEDDQSGVVADIAGGCVFEIATIDTATGDVRTEPTEAAAVKQETDVAIYGDWQKDGHILATKIYLLRYERGE